MTPVERIEHALRLMAQAHDEVSSARFEAVEVRLELSAELGVIERSQERLGGARLRLLKPGWQRFLALMDQIR